MADKKFVLRILALALVFGLFVVGCDTGGTWKQVTDMKQVTGTWKATTSAVSEYNDGDGIELTGEFDAETGEIEGNFLALKYFLKKDYTAEDVYRWVAREVGIDTYLSRQLKDDTLAQLKTLYTTFATDLSAAETAAEINSGDEGYEAWYKAWEAKWYNDKLALWNKVTTPANATYDYWFKEVWTKTMRPGYLETYYQVNPGEGPEDANEHARPPFEWVRVSNVSSFAVLKDVTVKTETVDTITYTATTKTVGKKVVTETYSGASLDAYLGIDVSDDSATPTARKGWDLLKKTELGSYTDPTGGNVVVNNTDYSITTTTAAASAGTAVTVSDLSGVYVSPDGTQLLIGGRVYTKQ